MNDTSFSAYHSREMARVQIAAQEESYKANGYDQYVFLAIGTACPDCLAINGQHFYVADMQAGENAPPMHPNCKCRVIAVHAMSIFDQERNVVPLEKNINYQKWKERFVKNGNKAK